MNTNNFNNCWLNCTKALQNELGSFAYKTWFEDLKFISFDGKNIILKSSDKFYVQHIERRFMDLLLNICSSNFNCIDISINILLEEELNELSQPSYLEEELNEYPSDLMKDNNLNKHYNFKNFIIGESNRLAHAASVAVGESPGIYNPLFLYGDVGLGKTHLMHAIANFILDKNPSAKVIYASCEKFTNELIASIREQKNREFREKYRKIDVLLIDDIQFIVDKTQTQEEFFHTFNDLKDSGKQIIISSDRPPNEIETLTERLRSRFAGGLIADIKAPNFETRTAILEKKAESLNFQISKEVSQFIAKSVKSNIRELEGALTRVIAYSNLTGIPVSKSLAENALRDIMVQETDVLLTFDNIMELVCEEFEVQEVAVKSKKRTKNIALARQVYMYLSREFLNESLINIGKTVSRDHSTVIHSIEKIENKLKTDKVFEATIFSIKSRLTGKQV